MQKQFSQMNEQERKDWLVDFQPWYATTLPEIEKESNIDREKFEQGLNFINVFGYCHSFVEESLRFKDYRSRKRLLRRFADKVAQDAQKMIGTEAVVDLTNPDLFKKHVGRPTKEQALARKLKAEQDRKEVEAKTQTVFGPMSDIPTVTPIVPGTVSGSVQGGSLLHLDQLKWLMSPALQEAVGTIRDLRAKAAEASTKAKQMAEDGIDAEKVKVYAQEAVQNTEAYERIYERVDTEMATVYVRLKEDTAYREEKEKQGVDIAALRTQLRPYFDKQEDKETFKARIIEDIKANDPKQAAEREKQEKIEAEARGIIKYLLRKDKPNTLHRVQEMKARYQRLAELKGKDYADDYLPLIKAAEENYQRNQKAKDASEQPEEKSSDEQQEEISSEQPEEKDIEKQTTDSDEKKDK